VLAETSDKRRMLAAFVMPNAPIPAEVPLTSFLVPIESLERVAGDSGSSARVDRLPEWYSTTLLAPVYRAGFKFFAQYLSDERRAIVDSRVPPIRGLPGPTIAGLITDGSSTSASRAWGRHAPTILDAPQHLCDVIRCQLPPENFWEKKGAKPKQQELLGQPGPPKLLEQ
jgi:hypothetical protein